jgi:hypothetical protein
MLDKFRILHYPLPTTLYRINARQLPLYARACLALGHVDVFRTFFGIGALHFVAPHIPPHAVFCTALGTFHLYCRKHATIEPSLFVSPSLSQAPHPSKFGISAYNTCQRSMPYGVDQGQGLYIQPLFNNNYKLNSIAALKPVYDAT